MGCALVRANACPRRGCHVSTHVNITCFSFVPSAPQQKTAFTDALTTLKNNIITAYNNDAGIRASVDGLYASRDAVFTSIDNTLALVDYADIVDVYGGVKNAICCTLPETLGSAWTATTIAGLLSLLLVLFVFFLIGKIDALPRADCCGCTFHTYKRCASLSRAADARSTAALHDGRSCPPH